MAPNPEDFKSKRAETSVEASEPDKTKADATPVLSLVELSDKPNERTAVGDGNSAKTVLTKAQAEMSEKIDRLQLQPYEPGASQLATNMGRAILSGDMKELKQIVRDKKDSPEFQPAIDQLNTALLHTNLHVHLDGKTQSLTLTRHPSLFIHDPDGAAVNIPLDTGESQGYTLKYGRRDHPIAKGAERQPPEFEKTTVKAEDAMNNLAEDAAKSLAKERDQLRSCVKTVKLIGDIENTAAIERETGKIIPAGPDKVTPAAIALLERRLGPLFRAVQDTKNEKERENLAAELHTRLREVGIQVAQLPERGLVIGIPPYAAQDGYYMTIPSKQGGPMSCVASRVSLMQGKAEQEPALYRPDQGPQLRPVQMAEAMTAILARAREYHSNSIR